MNKRKEATINTIANLLLTFVNLIVGFITTRLVLVNFGSDYNGLNTTINQIINIMLVVESGFALSANVALYKPISERNKEKIESILSAVNYVFLIVGAIVLIIGLASSFIAPLLIKTSVNYWEVVILFVLTVIPIVLRLVITTKYTTFLESTQKNYVSNIVKIVTSILILGSIYLIVQLGQPYIYIKSAYFVWNMASIFILTFIFKKIYRQYNIGINRNLSDIKGVSDVLIKKVTNVVYSTFPTLILGVFIGTNFVSVYGAYMLVISGITSVLGAFITGPKDSLGLLMAERDKKTIYDIFNKYTFIIFFLAIVFMATTATLIVPFIKLYTSGVTDINYIRPEFAYVMIVAALFSVIYGPYTHLLNGASIFKEARRVQVLAAILLVIVGTILTPLIGLIGVAIAMLIHDVVVSVGKMIVTYKTYFKHGFQDLIKYFIFIIFPSTLITILMLVLVKFDLFINDYFDFLIWGLIVFTINVCVTFIATYFPYKNIINYYFKKYLFHKKN